MLREELSDLPTPCIVVEASVPVWLKRSTANAIDERFSVIQSVTAGEQQGQITSFVDFQIDEESDWVLFSLPFVGRLVNPPEEPVPNVFARDPIQILLVDFEADKKELSLGLTSRGDDEAVIVELYEEENAANFTWDVLDPASLEQSFERLLRSKTEFFSRNRDSSGVELTESVLASDLDQSIGELAHQGRLLKLIQPEASNIPSFEGGKVRSATLSTSGVAWHKDGIMEITANVKSEDLQLYGFCFSGYHLFHGFLKQVVEKESPQRSVGVTQLPPLNPDFPQSCSLVVSPFVDLAFSSEQEVKKNHEEITNVVFAELLCFDQARNNLSSIGSHIISEPKSSTKENLKRWAIETHKRLAFDSPVAILRIRYVKTVKGDTASLAPVNPVVFTDYEFARVNIVRPEIPLSGSFPRKDAVERLSFPDGQYGGAPSKRNLKPFQVASPQVRGFEPLFVGQGLASSFNWRHGFSAASVSTRITSGGIGHGELSSSVYWHGLQHNVQYLSAVPGQFEKLLPTNFNAPTVKGYLSATPNRPVTKSPQAEASKQSVLPGLYKTIVSGIRPGVPFMFKSNLGSSEHADSQRPVWANGIPVQHRAPRPTSIARNVIQGQATANRTWGSFYSLEQTPIKLCEVSTKPYDNAFLHLAAPMELGLRLAKTSLSNNTKDGTIQMPWDGYLEFEITSSHGISADEIVEGTKKWKSSLSFVFDEIEIPIETGFEKKGNRLTIQATKSVASKISTVLAGNLSGAVVHVAVFLMRIEPESSNKQNYVQRLNFSLRTTTSTSVPLPIRPAYIQFEDPQYNRLLASETKKNESAFYLDGDSRSHVVVFTVDRHEYNPGSRLFCMFFMPKEDQDFCDKTTGKLRFQAIRDSDGSEVDLWYEGAFATVKCDDLIEVNLSKLQDSKGNGFEVDDQLLITLVLQHDSTEAAPAHPPLNVEIVGTPVNPATPNAYGLLRAENLAATTTRTNEKQIDEEPVTVVVSSDRQVYNTDGYLFTMFNVIEDASRPIITSDIRFVINRGA